MSSQNRHDERIFLTCTNAISWKHVTNHTIVLSRLHEISTIYCFHYNIGQWDFCLQYYSQTVNNDVNIHFWQKNIAQSSIKYLPSFDSVIILRNVIFVVNITYKRSIILTIFRIDNKIVKKIDRVGVHYQDSFLHVIFHSFLLSILHIDNIIDH